MKNWFLILVLPLLVACQNESMPLYKVEQSTTPPELTLEDVDSDLSVETPQVNWGEVGSVPSSELPQLQVAPDLNDSFYGKIEILDKQFVPKLDVVVVVDDSWSMVRHIANLKRSVNAFVKALNINDLIDFHVAVLPAWDSQRYGSLVQLPNYSPLGEFLPLALPGQSRSSTPLSDSRFVSKSTPNYMQVMEESLALEASQFCCSKAEVQRLQKVNEAPVHIGPQFEEFFPQVYEALTNSSLNQSVNGVNREFRRKGEHLAVVFFTDSDNNANSMWNAESFSNFLKRYTGDFNRSGNKLSTYAALHPSKLPSTKGCPKDYDQNTAYQIEEVIRLTNPPSLQTPYTNADPTGHQNIMNICSGGEFSQSLQKMGERLRKQTLAGHEVRFAMAPLPSNYQLVLCFGFEDEIRSAVESQSKKLCGAKGVTVPPAKGEGVGWVYNSQEEQVVLRGYHSLKRPDGADLYWRLIRE